MNKLNRIILVIMTLFVFGGVAPITISQSSEKLLEKSEDEILDEIIKLPDKDINIGFVALVLAKGYYPEVNIKKYLERIDVMARELKQQIGAEKDAEKIIQAFNHYIYAIRGMKAGSSTAAEANKLEAQEAFLNKLLDSDRGNCLGLSTLFLSLAERLNLPLYPVKCPSHYFIRYDDGKFRRNIETTAAGKEASDEFYFKGYITDEYVGETLREYIEYHGFLKNLTKKDLIEGILRTRAKCYNQKGETSLGSADWMKAIKISSNISNTYRHMADQLAYYLDKKDYNEALIWINKAIASAPNFFENYTVRANIYTARNELEKALQDRNKAVELTILHSGSFRCYCDRGVTYFLMNEYEKASLDFRRAVELKSDYIFAWNNLGVALYKLKQYEEAIKAYNKTIDLNPKHNSVWANKGEALGRLGKYEEALESYTKSIGIDPNNGNNWYGCACTYALKGDKKKALENLTKAISLDAKYKEKAKKDEDFNAFWKDDDFKKITSTVMEK